MADTLTILLMVWVALIVLALSGLIAILALLVGDICVGRRETTIESNTFTYVPGHGRVSPTAPTAPAARSDSIESVTLVPVQTSWKKRFPTIEKIFGNRTQRYSVNKDRATYV